VTPKDSVGKVTKGSGILNRRKGRAIHIQGGQGGVERLVKERTRGSLRERTINLPLCGEGTWKGILKAVPTKNYKESGVIEADGKRGEGSLLSGLKGEDVYYKRSGGGGGGIVNGSCAAKS